MNLIRAILRKLRSFGQPRALKPEIDEELRFHIEQRAAQNVSSGMSADEAAREARKRFGNFQAVREECREMRRFAVLENLAQDFRFGFRVLLKHPGSLLASLAAVTLGIGLVTMMLCAINALMFQGLSQPVAQVSKPAVSPISKSAGRPKFVRGAGLETGDTADSEVCATIPRSERAPGRPPSRK